MPRDLAAATRRAWERLERLLAHRKSPLLANLAPGTTDVALDRFEQETKQTLPADGRDALEKLVFASCWAEFLHKTADAIEAGEVECSEGMTLVSESRVASFDDAWLPFCNRRGSDGRAEDD